MYNNFKMKSYFFETYGCEMNIAESAAVEQLFIARGWQRSESAQTADVAVINTCSIRETAENRILGRLGWFSGLKAVRECKLGAKTKMLEEALEYVKDGPKPLTLIVMGCMAERLLKSFQKPIRMQSFLDVMRKYRSHLKEETNHTWSTADLKVLYQECKGYTLRQNQAIQENTFQNSCLTENVMSVTVKG
jgi:tRNA A37 methylthiotransferase MiaB